MLIKNWLSRYSSRYPRALVYMLQASEYTVADYLAWYHQTKDFSRVEKRKKLVMTSKAKLLWLATWTMGLVWLGLGAIVLLFNPDFGRVIILLVWVSAAPYFLAYALIIALGLVKLVQWPIENRIIRYSKIKLARHPGLKIAIAGSFGKTSFREILKTVLAEGRKVAAAPHSYNTPLGISQFIKSLCGDEEILIFELGEYYPGDIKKLCDLVAPQWGIITGVNEAHLEKFKTLEQTTKTIFELADYLGNQPLYLNGENQLAQAAAPNQALVYSRTGVGEWQVINAQTDLAGTKFALTKAGVEIKVSSSLLGWHQIGPLAAAADIAFKLGLNAGQIERGLSKTQPFDHRLEPKIDPQGVIILDDSYNGNPDGVKAVIDFLAGLKDHQRWYITPGLVEMGSRKQTVHQEIGKQLAASNIEKIVLIKNSATPFIAEGLAAAGYSGKIIWYSDGLMALQALPHLTVAGDVVLLQNDWPDQYR
ncbi:MAG: UDP-N-acetylmuramoyl-tripeptide--D-alanyl-D-alanine ligase [Candidatus Komeilibacteria bacterium]|nr:UDP-N-acetylmuramoyl-tripeptide--D-alanyl-D-alanine ligase [Candidatus Komeilibacteria bacterium]